ncbi:hypothetical protein DFH07DRAFT_556668 [Mycena maculata]|uniref:Uncharacterized protein n=1 Tax=Mycena maculata TaxID=230809 RepID=A0AAD7IS03_9AGAR|nr:hypothetical protein DFH07DRAFT_556668 [Mycena maculata]
MDDEFSTNATIPTPPTPPKAPIWAHLFMLEKFDRFCGTGEAATPHTSGLVFTPISSIPEAERPPYQQMKEAADAIALICATGVDANHVSACAIERNAGSKSDSPLTYTVRISKNGALTSHGVESLAKLLDETAATIRAFDLTTVASQRTAVLHATPALLEKVVTRCHQKIQDSVVSGGMNGGRAALSRWAAEQEETEHKNEYNQLLLIVCRPSAPTGGDEGKETPKKRRKGKEDLEGVRIDSEKTREAEEKESSSKIVSAHLLEKKYASEVKTMPPEAQLYLAKLSRYLNASKNLAWSMVYLGTQESKAAIVGVEPLPILPGVRSPEDDDEPPDLESYLKQEFDVALSALHPDKYGSARDTWSGARTDRKPFFHAELQLAIFYTLNPDCLPMGSYLGVSKRCCALCDFVLKYVLALIRISIRGLQRTDHPFIEASAGPAILISIHGKHGGLTQNWCFPDLDKFPSSLPPLRRAQLATPLSLIRDELSQFLKARVSRMLPFLVDAPADRRSSESDRIPAHSEDSDAEQDNEEYTFLNAHYQLAV